MPEPMKPIERTLLEFETAAKEYHALKLSKPTTAKQKQALDKELADRLADLQNRRRRLKVESSVAEQVAKQKALKEYRSANDIVLGKDGVAADSRFGWMENEAHHPTDDLRRNMAAVGDVPPDDNCSCHHIVEGVGKLVKDPVSGAKVRTQNSIEARATLHMFGIGINDPVNGVFLPKGMKYIPHWRFPKALPHANIHTLAYEKLVNDSIKNLTGKQSIEASLFRVRTMLEQGSNICFLTDRTQKRYTSRIV